MTDLGLDSGGTLLLAGVRSEEVDRVQEAFRRHGLGRGVESERSGWVQLEFVAPW